MRILLYLLEMGATVGHRSVRCRVTALDWSRNMRRGHFKRALELEQVVQQNVLTLFRSIGCGDFPVIENLLDFTSMIQDNAPTAARRPKAAKEKKSRVGMKFDPLLPAKIQNEMELFLQSAKGECSTADPFDLYIVSNSPLPCGNLVTLIVLCILARRVRKGGQTNRSRHRRRPARCSHRAEESRSRAHRSSRALRQDAGRGAAHEEGHGHAYEWSVRAV